MSARSAGHRAKAEIFQTEMASMIGDNLGQPVRQTAGHMVIGRFVIGCERRAEIPQYEWFGEVQKAVSGAQTPLVVIRADGEVPLVLLALEDFLKLARPN